MFTLSDNCARFGEEFKEILRSAIKECGGQNKFARRCGLSNTTLSRILNSSSYITLDSLAKVGKVLKELKLDNEPNDIIMPKVSLIQNGSSTIISNGTSHVHILTKDNNATDELQTKIAKYLKLSEKNRKVADNLIESLLEAQAQEDADAEKTK